MTTVDLIVPDIGDVDSVEVIEVLVSDGDNIAVDDSLITVESDKASMEIPATTGGVIESISVSVGSSVKTGDVIGRVNVAEAAAAPSTQSTAPAAAEAAPPSTPAPEPAAAAPTGPDTGGGSQSPVSVTVPDIGDVDEVEVIEVLVQKGDKVAEEQSLVTVESDKASMEIPAPQAGTVTELSISVGDKVSKGSALLQLLPQAGSGATPAPAAAAPAPPPTPAPTETKPQTAASPANTGASGTRAASPTAHIDGAKAGPVHASPGVRRYAREHGADLRLVKGSGHKDRILKTDVTSFIKGAMESAGSNYGGSTGAGGSGIPSVPDIDFSKFGEIERVPLGRINKISASNLHRAWLNVPMVTHHDEADITEMEAFRKSLKNEAKEGDPKITGLAFHMKALVQSLKAFPKLNSSLTADGEALIYKKYFHVGIAVDTPNGLVVPVFKDVDRKSISELAVEMADVSKRAREKKLKPEEMQGASMTISNIGGIGGTAFTPIVNTPEVAILGLAKARMQPVWNGSEFKPRLMAPVDLSYDHRVVDGADAARFVAFYCQSVGDVRRLLI